MLPGTSGALKLQTPKLQTPVWGHGAPYSPMYGNPPVDDSRGMEKYKAADMWQELVFATCRHNKHAERTPIAIRSQGSKVVSMY